MTVHTQAVSELGAPVRSMTITMMPKHAVDLASNGSLREALKAFARGIADETDGEGDTREAGHDIYRLLREHAPPDLQGELVDIEQGYGRYHVWFEGYVEVTARKGDDAVYAAVVDHLNDSPDQPPSTLEITVVKV